MEQVADNHGSGILDIHTPGVAELVDPRRSRDFEPPRSFREFYRFPKECGWKVTEGYELEITQSSPRQLTLPLFIQAWLFFGLVQTIVQTDGTPVLSFDDLHKNENLSTAHLHDAIEIWTKWEENHPEGQRFRMVQIGWVLDMARHVVQKMFAYGSARNDKVDDKDVLVIMCLGETLGAAKARIVEANKRIDMTGWHGDDFAGWGPPRWVFERMKEEEWCPRTMEILRGQVSTNATMLVAAYQAYQKSRRMTTSEHRESGCTRLECKVQSKDVRGKYKSHHHRPCDGKECKPYGPPMEQIIEIYKENDGTRNIIPLLVMTNKEKEEPQFELRRFDPDSSNKPSFVTISHVWSDGWGNEKENKLNRCQLEFIRRQIGLATGGKDNTPFWMDTLVVPVADEDKESRRKAIRQIFDVFGQSENTIILDNGLSSMNKGGPVAEAAMKIFSSVWMRRLWTLQEAYLSNKIYIPFEEGSDGTNNLVTFEDIEKKLEEHMKTPKSGITQTIRIQLSRMIIGEERRKWKSWRGANGTAIDNMFKRNYAMLVANTYRAARWRTTGKAEHEVLALATLLKLDSDMTPNIEEAGLEAPDEQRRGDDGDKAKAEADAVNRLETLVCEFWQELDRSYGAIPSGIIFLPGAKVNRRGFGWAPRTWLSAYEMDYPDPLSFWDEPTQLDTKGLRVCYRGFLLHSDSTQCRSRILLTSAGAKTFTFPVDRSLNECYTIQHIKDDYSNDGREVTRQLSAKSQLAVILSGGLPHESPPEIALLVEVTPERKQSRTKDTLDTKTEFRASIIRRVLIWRATNYLRTESDRQRFKMGFDPNGGDSDDDGLDDKKQDFCLGEARDASQCWWVDRPVQPKLVDVPPAANRSSADQRNGTTVQTENRSPTMMMAAQKLINLFRFSMAAPYSTQ